DEFGHAVQTPLAAFETLPFTFAREAGVAAPIDTECVLRALSFVSATPAGAGGFDLTFTARVENRKLAAPAPLADHAVTARVIRNGALETNIDMNGGAPASVIGSQLGFNDLYG